MMAPLFWHKKRGHDRFDWKRPHHARDQERLLGSSLSDDGCMFRGTKPDDALDFARLPWLNLLDKLALPMFRKVILTGGLSTGKSTLLYQQAERLAKIGKKVLIILCQDMLMVRNLTLRVDVYDGFKDHTSAKVFAIWSSSARGRIPELLQEHPNYHVFIEDTTQESIYDDGGVALVKEWGALVLPANYFWMVLRPFHQEVDIPKLEEAGFTIPRLQYGLGSSAQQLRKRLEGMSDAYGQASPPMRDYLDRRRRIKIPNWRGFGNPVDLDMQHCPMRLRPVEFFPRFTEAERIQIKLKFENYLTQIGISKLPWPVPAEQTLIRYTNKLAYPPDWALYFLLQLKLLAHRFANKIRRLKN